MEDLAKLEKQIKQIIPTLGSSILSKFRIWSFVVSNLGRECQSITREMWPIGVLYEIMSKKAPNSKSTM